MQEREKVLNFKNVVSRILCFLLILFSLLPVKVQAITKLDTPNYKVAFFAFDCYHMQDESGKRTGYGYEMMQGISEFIQGTFSYVAYDKSASECEQLLKTGEVDLYTAAKKTLEREEYFIFSKHPSITSFTCMNVKVGNNKIVAGDYSTYDGIRVGLLRRHTYNDSFIEFAKDKGIDCEIVYYETPTELSNALVNDEVDALVNSYIRIPEDEKTIETFGETPYYIMARKEDKPLMDEIDNAFDCMNLETPNWRTKLYNKYYGSEEYNLSLTDEEQVLLSQMQKDHEVVSAVMNPDAAPYSWYENGEPKGIAFDIFKATVDKLGLDYEIIPTSSKEEYEEIVASGKADVWMDLDGYYEDENESKYKISEPYLTTTMSVLRERGNTNKITRLVSNSDHISVKEIVANSWPGAKFTIVDSVDECVRMVSNGKADGALLMTYTAQRVVWENSQNRFRVDIVPGAQLEIKMGINSNIDHNFFSLWKKTLKGIANQSSEEIVQGYLERTSTPSLTEYINDHPTILVGICFVTFLLLVMCLLYVQSIKNSRKQEKILEDLKDALEKAEEATKLKQDFFSKMSHDIRTPLNVVLGMTQVAQKYKNNPDKLDNALMNIKKEGDYLLVLINSILDVNQLEHGTIELINKPFNPTECLKESIEILRPMYEKKEQNFNVESECEDNVVSGDVNRLRQILINIASNAIKYTGVGGNISFRLEYVPENKYRFICKDNGMGMTKEFVQHICENYTRAEDSRVSKIQGTGLGMAVVKGFTEKMGGTLSIDSEIGKGSTFIVELPFDTVENKDDVPVDEDVSYFQYTGKKALLIEDNELNAEIAIELLQTIGLSVDWSENGKIGLERYEASDINEYFVIFMDMQMPVMDGITTSKMIRQSKRSDHDIPILALTANTFASDQKACKEAGMNGYISKPVSVKDIENSLKSIRKSRKEV